MKASFILATAGLTLSLTACGGEEDSLPDVDCGAVPTPSFSEVTGFTKCVVCHSSTAPNRNDAPVGVDFDTYDAAAEEAEEAAAEVFNGEMPPAGFATLELTDSEAATLYQWALCGAPE